MTVTDAEAVQYAAPLFFGTSSARETAVYPAG